MSSSPVSWCTKTRMSDSPGRGAEQVGPEGAGGIADQRLRCREVVLAGLGQPVQVEVGLMERRPDLLPPLAGTGGIERTLGLLGLVRHRLALSSGRMYL